MNYFKVFGIRPPPKQASNGPFTFREWPANDDSNSGYNTEEEAERQQAKKDKKTIATIKTEDAAGYQKFVNDRTDIDKGLAQINARHGVPGYDPMSPTGYTKGGRRRKRPTRRSRKTKSKRRKTRRRRR